MLPAAKPSVSPVDPVAAILKLQREQQRFALGFVASLVVAAIVTPIYALTSLSTPSTSKLHLGAMLIPFMLIGLTMRVVGRVVELKLASVAGALALLAMMVGDYLALIVRHTEPLAVPGGGWFLLLKYGVVAWAATAMARRDLDVSLSAPEHRGEGVAVPSPHAFEDPNATVLEEVVSIVRGGWNSVPGKLKLTSRDLSFFQKTGHIFSSRTAATPSLVIPLRELASVERGLRDRLFIVKRANGEESRFIVFDRDKWIVQLNARRH